MARGISLHVGINKVSPTAFPDLAPLVGCENDAVSMRDIAVLKGFDPATLLQGKQATFQNVVTEIQKAVAALNAEEDGGTFLFTFAGHGCPTTDVESLEEEPDELDENIVLFDLILLDDYMKRVLWPMFNEGVRIVGVADSCHSGTSLMAVSDVDTIVVTEHRAVTVSSGAGSVATVTDVHTVELFSLDDESPAAHVPEPAFPHGLPADDDPVLNVDGPFRDGLSVAEGLAHIAANKPSYVEMEIPPLDEALPIKASVLTLAACQDEEKTRDGFPHGAFTAALLEVWDGGAFPGTYVTFMNEIRNKFKGKVPAQFPVLKPDAPPAFSSEHPFSI